MSVLVGSHGASAGASTAITTRMPTTTAPMQARRLRENVRQNCLISPRRARAAGRMPNAAGAAPRSGCAGPRARR